MSWKKISKWLVCRRGDFLFALDPIGKDGFLFDKSARKKWEIWKGTMKVKELVEKLNEVKDKDTEISFVIDSKLGVTNIDDIYWFACRNWFENGEGEEEFVFFLGVNDYSKEGEKERNGNKEFTFRAAKSKK